ncbi:MAG: DMT family transporter [Anaerolineales bacterium]
MRQWIAFAILSIAWGANFLWIKVGVQEIGPLMLVAWRLGFDLLGMLVVMRVGQISFPRDVNTWLKLVLLGMINPAIPFVLIAWGEQRIASGLAAVLNSTMPLFVLILAHFLLQDERMSLRKSLGLAVGFGGVFVIVMRSPNVNETSSTFFGYLAVLLATFSYAFGAVYVRRYLRDISPVVQTACMLLVAEVLLWVAVAVFETPHVWPSLRDTWISIVWLGILGTTVGYLMFFYLIREWGATRSSLVTYVLPVIGLVLGIVFLGESIDARLWVGTTLVLCGIVIVNRRVARPLPRIS